MYSEDDQQREKDYRVRFYLAEPTFSENLEPNYLCVKCHKPLYEPVQTPCGHRICISCGDLLLETAPASCPAQEVDCEVIEKDTILHPDKWMRKHIRRCTVYCAYSSEGCTHLCSWNKLESHLKGCDYLPLPCQNSGCSKLVPAVRLQDHQENECNFRVTTCIHCGQSTPFYQEQEHLDECEEILITCPHNCSERTFRRRALDFHLRTCPRAPEDCSYKHIGCSVSLCQQDLAYHLKNDTDYHLKLSVLRIANIEAELAQCKTLLSERHSELDRVKQQFQSLLVKQDDLEKKEVDRSQLADELTSLVEYSRKELDETKAELAKQRKTNAELDSKCSSVLKRLELLESKLSATSGKESGYYSSVSSSGATGHTQNSSLESIPYGSFTWKITNYSVKKREALSGLTFWLDSEPFYTERYGYKIKLRLYPNGDGKCKNIYVSVFVVVMKGEYDNILHWPLNCMVTISLLNQRRGNNITQTFSADLTSNSFQKPVNDSNVATGFPDFVLQDELESKLYLNDNCIFLRASVKTHTGQLM